MSTVSPRANRDLTEHVRAHEATMLDAPVSGSVPSPDGWPPARQPTPPLGGVKPVESA
jgi:6-phosphogluconate dehydrogenase-like protein